MYHLITNNFYVAFINYGITISLENTEYINKNCKYNFKQTTIK